MSAKTNPTSRRKSTSRRFSSQKKKKSQPRMRTMPIWLRNLLALCIVVVFSAGFYWFFIRPYAYRWKPCYGQKGYGVCMPCNYEVHGIDISHYQGDIDWERLLHSKDVKFPIHFIFMKASKGDLPPVLDVETTGKKSPEELKVSVKTWLDRIEAHYGMKPILYTSYKFKKRYLNDSIFNTYPYWIAHYYVDSVRYEGKWHFWQHTDVGVVPGIEEEVDLNVFNGTLEELQSLTLQK